MKIRTPLRHAFLSTSFEHLNLPAYAHFGYTRRPVVEGL
jgi:hypothetical protein